MHRMVSLPIFLGRLRAWKVFCCCCLDYSHCSLLYTENRTRKGYFLPIQLKESPFQALVKSNSLLLVIHVSFKYPVALHVAFLVITFQYFSLGRGLRTEQRMACNLKNSCQNQTLKWKRIPIPLITFEISKYYCYSFRFSSLSGREVLLNLLEYLSIPFVLHSTALQETLHVRGLCLLLLPLLYLLLLFL